MTNMVVSVKCKALTPIWTGDAGSRTTYLRATSFLGGLRTWSEALLRSLGYRVCDEQGRCTHGPDNPRGPCRLCRDFGCTGLSRAFRMTVEYPENSPKRKLGRITLPRRRDDDKTPKWYLEEKEGLKPDQLTIKLVPMRPRADLDLAVTALHLMLHWGALGAQDQFGYGLVRVMDEALARQAGEALERLIEAAPAQGHNTTADRPDLRDFFFFQGRMDRTWLKRMGLYEKQGPFELRYLVRQAIRENDRFGNENRRRRIRHAFCGNVQGGSMGTRYNLGRVGEDIHGWGWLSPHWQIEGVNDAGRYREACIGILKEKVENLCAGHHQWQDWDRNAEGWPDRLREMVANPWR